MFDFLKNTASMFQVFGAGATLFGGFSANKRLNQQANQLLGIAEREVEYEMAAAGIEIDRIRRTGVRQIGEMSASIGASGFQMRGTSLDVIAESVMELEMDKIITQFNAERQAFMIREEAGFRAKSMRADGRSGLVRSVGSAAMQLAGSGLFSED